MKTKNKISIHFGGLLLNPQEWLTEPRLRTTGLVACGVNWLQGTRLWSIVKVRLETLLTMKSRWQTKMVKVTFIQNTKHGSRLQRIANVHHVYVQSKCCLSWTCRSDYRDKLLLHGLYYHMKYKMVHNVAMPRAQISSRSVWVLVGWDKVLQQLHGVKQLHGNGCCSRLLQQRLAQISTDDGMKERGQEGRRGASQQGWQLGQHVRPAGWQQVRSTIGINRAAADCWETEWTRQAGRGGGLVHRGQQRQLHGRCP